LNGKEHVDFRRWLNNLFTRKALAVYLESQDAITRHHFNLWLDEARKNPNPATIMHTTRYLNMHTSLRVFCGHHIPEEAITIISDNYWKITVALELVNFPLALPGTKVWGAIQARKIAMKHLEAACKSSKEYIQNGGEVKCMIDQWVKDVLEAKEKALAEESSKMPREFSDHEMALVVLSFLFASQDAMSSGVIYMFQHLADHPEILAKIREEQKRVRGGDYSKPMTLQQVDEMVYLRAVIKESLRLKPPVTMVRRSLLRDKSYTYCLLGPL
jgi:sterol 22-desaturase